MRLFDNTPRGQLRHRNGFPGRVTKSAAILAAMIVLFAFLSGCPPRSGGGVPSGPAVTSASLSDVVLTQSGLVTRPLPPMPMVAGKTTLLLGTVTLSDSSAVVQEAVLRVVRESDDSLAGTVRGYAIAKDDRTLVDWIRAGDQVHFFIPGDLFVEGASYRLDYSLKVAGRTFKDTALSAISCRENRGISLVVTTFDDGIFRNLSALFRFSAHMEHTGRIFPVKDSVGSLLPYGASWRGADGVRFEYFGELPIAAQGDLGDFENEFVYKNMQVGNAFQPGKFLAFNFSVGEDLNGDGDFNDLNEQGGALPQQKRIANLGNFFINQMESQKRFIRNWLRREVPVYRMTFVTAGATSDPMAQNRTGFLGNAIGWTSMWLAGDEPAVFQQELAHEMGIGQHTQDRGLPATLPGPGYDLYLKRRVQTPKNIMDAGGSTPLRNSFLSDQDFDAIHGRLMIAASADNSSRRAVNVATHTHVHGLMSASGNVISAELRTEPSPESAEAISSDFVLRLLDVDGEEIRRAPIAIEKVVDDKRIWDGEVTFRGQIGFDPNAASLVLERDGLTLKRFEVSKSKPILSYAAAPLDFSAKVVKMAWKGIDADGDLLTYDVSLFYPKSGKVVGLAGGIRTSRLSIPSSRIPGGKEVVLRIDANDGFHTSRLEIPGLAIPNRAPRLHLMNPLREISLPSSGTTSLVVSATDPEEGNIAAERISWRTEKGRFLGNGSRLLAHLSKGKHRITVTAVDNEGATAEETFTVVVK